MPGSHELDGFMCSWTLRRARDPSFLVWCPARYKWTGGLRTECGTGARQIGWVVSPCSPAVACALCARACGEDVRALRLWRRTAQRVVCVDGPAQVYADTSLNCTPPQAQSMSVVTVGMSTQNTGRGEGCTHPLTEHVRHAFAFTVSQALWSARHSVWNHKRS